MGEYQFHHNISGATLRIIITAQSTKNRTQANDVKANTGNKKQN